MGIATTVYPIGLKTGGETPLSWVKYPSEMIAITDTAGRRYQDFHLYPDYGTVAGPGNIHGGGANALFCDGHVLWYPQLELALPDPPYTGDKRARYDRIARMWNFDHRP